MRSQSDSKDLVLYSPRPSSDHLVELHIYVVPSDLWREYNHSAVNEIIPDTISAGFIRVHPEEKIEGLRSEIEDQLGRDVVPLKYVFLKSVGRCLTVVRVHQEREVKVKHFRPPYAYLPELFVMEETPDIQHLLEGGTRRTNQTPASLRSSRRYAGRYDPNAGQFGDMSAGRNGDAVGNRSAERGENRYGVSGSNKQVNPYPGSQYPGTDAAHTSYRGSIYNYQGHENPSDNGTEVGVNGRHAKDRYLAERLQKQKAEESQVGKPNDDLASTSLQSSIDNEQFMENLHDSENKKKEDNDNLIDENNGQSYKRTAFESNLNAGRENNDVENIHGTHDRNRNNNFEKNFPGSLKVDNDGAHLEAGNAEDVYNLEKIRDEEKTDYVTEGKRDQYGTGNEPNTIRITQTDYDPNHLDPNQMDGGMPDPNSVNWMHADGQKDGSDENDLEKELQKEENDRLTEDERRKDEIRRLRAELDKRKAERLEAEKMREEIIKRARYTNNTTSTKRGQARDIWKKRYFEEKKKTPPLEEEANGLRREIDTQTRKLLHFLEQDRPDAGGLDGSNSSRAEKVNFKKESVKLRHAILDLQQRVESTKMKLTAEMKLRNQAETELKSLRADMIQKKIGVTLSRQAHLPVKGFPGEHPDISPREPRFGYGKA